MKRQIRFVSVSLTLALLIGTVFGGTASAAVSPYVKSDTAQTIDLKEGQTYTFRFTVVGKAAGVPSFYSADADSLSLTVKSHNGSVYFVAVRAEDSFSGASVGVYSRLPGQAAQRQAVVNIPDLLDIGSSGESLGYYAGSMDSLEEHFHSAPTDLSVQNGTSNGKIMVTNWLGRSKSFNVLGFDDDFGGAPVTVTSSDPSVVQLSASSLTCATKEESFGMDFSQPGLYGRYSRSLPPSARFEATSLKAGKATVTVAAKSKSGKVRSFELDFDVRDPSSAAFQSDSPASLTVSKGKSYTFRISAAKGYADVPADFSNSGTIHDSKSSDYSGSLDESVKQAGNGVYLVTVTARPAVRYGDFGESYYDSNESVKSGDVFTLTGHFAGLDETTLCRITVR